MTGKNRVAVVLLNLGGPDRLDAVQPFLFNLFNDPAIIRVPGPFRWLLAQLISRRRAPVAREIYRSLGGGSPLLPNTREQAVALQAVLAPSGEFRVFIAMRYWHPMAPETVNEVKNFAPDQIILLPLYPQWSTTTTASSVVAWNQAAAAAGLTCPTRLVCCYPTEPGFISAATGLIETALDAAAAHGRPRLLLSAHGLPQRVVAGGDPYQWQCEQTARAIMAALARRELDWTVCYQSRVGPLKWIGPSTDDEIRRAGQDRVPVVIVPIAFVSEHSETLVEIEIEYRHLAGTVGVPHFHRVPAVGTARGFIAGLAALVVQSVRSGDAVRSGTGRRLCPAPCSGCALPAPQPSFPSPR